jgi:hypothetical protein
MELTLESADEGFDVAKFLLVFIDYISINYSSMCHSFPPESFTCLVIKCLVYELTKYFAHQLMLIDRGVQHFPNALKGVLYLQ